MNDTEARDVIGAALGRIAPEVDLDEVDSTEPMTRELDMDSMDMLSLLEEIRQRTGIDIPDVDVDPMWSLDAMVGYLASR